MMEDNKQLAQRIDGAIQSASQEVTNLRSELSATSRRLAELGACNPTGLENNQQNHHHHHHHHLHGGVDDLSLRINLPSYFLSSRTNPAPSFHLKSTKSCSSPDFKRLELLQKKWKDA
ncbi:kazrin [Triplophysa rosa]|uniref:Kazrin n=1 Tax=Triplophysa rosa TaxID=992332 RepID=A0A9W7TAI1_TRIRA|nr:kazrin [Triplophysa rosa]